MSKPSDHVFINCPFDKQYKTLLNSIMFTIIDCGYNPRCALEIQDSSTNRLQRICEIIRKCRYGIHDLSRTSLDSKNKLPRFNMPLELGLFLGAKQYGVTNQKKKICLIMDKNKYRYQKFISDIAGMDIKAHSERQKRIISIIRDWLAGYSKKSMPSGSIIARRYDIFKKQKPDQSRRGNLKVNELTYRDEAQLMVGWIEKNDIVAK